MSARCRRWSTDRGHDRYVRRMRMRFARWAAAGWTSTIGSQAAARSHSPTAPATPTPWSPICAAVLSKTNHSGSRRWRLGSPTAVYGSPGCFPFRGMRAALDAEILKEHGPTVRERLHKARERVRGRVQERARVASRAQGRSPAS